jgi:hypothetical protein
MSTIPIINIGDTLELKKQHPCGQKLFKVLRIGADIKIECIGCKRTLTLDRLKIEKMIKKIIPGGKSDE